MLLPRVGGHFATVIFISLASLDGDKRILIKESCIKRVFCIKIARSSAMEGTSQESSNERLETIPQQVVSSHTPVNNHF